MGSFYGTKCFVYLTGDVELSNMQLKPEALNALKLPVKVKAGFLGSVKLKVCGIVNIFPYLYTSYLTNG